MAGDTDNPRIWANADVYVAPVGSTAPTTVSGAWDAAWDDLGLLSEDGITEAQTDQVTTHYALGGILVRRVRSQHERTFTVTLLEDTPAVFALLNPGSDAATATGVTTRHVHVPTPAPMAFGIETTDGSITRRIIIDRGEVTAVADHPIASDTEMAAREATITVYPDSDGLLYTEITNDPQAVEA